MKISSSACDSPSMSLTGKPLILLAALITLLVLAATVVLWRRTGRWRLVIRPLGVLLTEALLIVTCGLWANRHAQFYPTWSALLAAGAGEQAAQPVPAGSLDSWLAGHPPAQGTFSWQPRGWADWGLAQAPTVTLPAGYAEHPDRRFSVVVIMGAPAPAPARDAVLISVPVTAATPPAVLATALPAAAAQDLRVTAQRWALVVPPGVTTASVTAAGTRYPAVAIVGTGTGITVPEGIDLHPEPTLPAAVDWAVAQTPPPLALGAPAAPEGPPHGAEQSRR